jgi:replicative DNA helicase
MAKIEPAQNLPAERMILGALLRADAAYWKVADLLRPEHFALPIHGRVYAAIAALATDGKRIGLQALVARIGEEYDDGQSTSFFLSALRRDAEDSDDGGVWQDMVDPVVDAYRKRRANDLLAWARSELAKPDSHGDDILADMKARLDEIEEGSNALPIKWIGEIAKRAVANSKTARDTNTLQGWDTGLAHLDEILGRIHPGDLGFVLAAPGDGKTVLGCQFARRVAILGGTSIIFQLEMRDEDLARRELAGESGLSVAEIEEGAYDFVAYDALMDAQDRLTRRRIAIDDRPKLRIEQIYDRCKLLKRTQGLSLAVVDHLRLVRTSARVRDKFERAEYVTGEMKAMAKDLGIAVVCLSQVTRSSQRRDDPTPQRSDGDGGSSIEQDADWAIAMLRRDRWLKPQRPHDEESSAYAEWLAKMNKARGRIELTILKRRRGEDGEKREFMFDGKAGLIREIEK